MVRLLGIRFKPHDAMNDAGVLIPIFEWILQQSEPEEETGQAG